MVTGTVQCSGRHDCLINPILFGVVATPVLAVTGALIGGFFPKRAEPEVPN